jgi:lactate dehydrogenase-like 2-hydroxyacid dehydrogenase
MQPSAFLVNIARAEIFDEGAFGDALSRRSRIAKNIRRVACEEAPLNLVWL